MPSAGAMAAVASVRVAPVAQQACAVDVRRQVGVTDGEPGRLAVALEHRVRRVMRVAGDAPAALRVDEPAQRVEQRVDVGADEQAVDLGVVADVGDDGELDVRDGSRTRGPASSRPCRPRGG